MLHAAVDAARAVNPALLVLGVTVLTSLDQNDLEKIGIPGNGARRSLAPLPLWP